MITVVLAAAAAATAVRPSGRGLLATRGVGRASPQVRLLRGHGGGGGLPATTGSRSSLARWRPRRVAAARRTATIELCHALSAELRAGAMPADALERAVASVPGLCDQVGRVARLGGDASAALVAASLPTGCGGLAQLAMVWSVTHQAGSGLADGCERVGDWLRDDEALRREVAAQLAGARSSARLLAVLPVFGLLVGSSSGADPVGVLLGTTYGLGCLVVGTALALTGLWWTERLARGVEDRV